MRALQGDLQRFNKALKRKAKIVGIAQFGGFMADHDSAEGKFRWEVFTNDSEKKKTR